MPIKIKYKTTTEHEREEVVYFEPTKENLEAFLAPNERVVGGIEILEQWEDDSALPVVEDVIEEEIIEEEIIEEVTEDPYTYDYSIAETNTAKKEESVYYEDGIS
jgi:hypothetical protein